MFLGANLLSQWRTDYTLLSSLRSLRFESHCGDSHIDLSSLSFTEKDVKKTQRGTAIEGIPLVNLIYGYSVSIN